VDKRLDRPRIRGPQARLQAGAPLLIPGNTPHNETGTSDTFELLEISVPAEMGASPCAPACPGTASWSRGERTMAAM